MTFDRFSCRGRDVECASRWQNKRRGGMISLNDDRWNELRHAYFGGSGQTSDVPDALRQLARSESDEEFDARLNHLMMGLWHQGDLFPAAFAVAPHLELMCEFTSLHRRTSLIRCISMFEVARVEAMSRGGSVPNVPSDIESAYTETIRRLPALVAQCAWEAWDYNSAVELAGALLVGAGFAREGDSVMQQTQPSVANKSQDEASACQQ